METFVAAVVERFALGRLEGIAVEPMLGSTNRLWRFETGAGVFVVKELSHDSPHDLPRRQRAATFERHVFESRAIAMPEPVLTPHGDVVVPVAGSRGRSCAVRVHRWLDGDRIVAPGRAFLGAAGASLHLIQQAGSLWSEKETGSLRWWDVDPLVVAERLRASPLADLGVQATSIAPDALAVVAMAEELEGPWIYSHCDHKPENALAVAGLPAVFDWDECGHCHPRLEAVEAALRWATLVEPDRAAFRAFLDGYCASGGTAHGLSERDFGKWLAALLGWFSFQGRRALGDWPSDTAAERDAAEVMARDAVQGLAKSLSVLDVWAGWY